MFKSAGRNEAEGRLDRFAGRLLELVGTVTGRKTTKAKGRAARMRGSARRRSGRTKRALR
jgi:uncharacterized protein YjbJ (UPF0337 family)